MTKEKGKYRVTQHCMESVFLVLPKRKAGSWNEIALRSRRHYSAQKIELWLPKWRSVLL